MADRHCINTQELEHEAHREQQLKEAIAAEKHQVQRLKELVAQIVEECPSTWRYGDGDGGTVMSYLYSAADLNGLRTCPNPHNPATGEGTGVEEYTVYRFYDAAGDLLYVGVSSNAIRRWEQHQRTKPWFGEVAVITRSLFEDKETAYEAEIRAIIHETPKYNIVHNGLEGK
ncbi:GIY-YIG nuclease family protein [uncultured Corynebacterium sp.]|uniref:GIY-YIG nuclease family protein n=1 Tax=uncultured Corynebacterium sp. TaxID=159447 RepID=UPI0025E2AC9C|nr:GIY-YIG nuclease family protein [uncultured Corynebacterium sp.]